MLSRRIASNVRGSIRRAEANDLPQWGQPRESTGLSSAPIFLLSANGGRPEDRFPRSFRFDPVSLEGKDGDAAREVSKPSHLIAKRVPSPASSRLGQKAVALDDCVGVHR